MFWPPTALFALSTGVAGAQERPVERAVPAPAHLTVTRGEGAADCPDASELARSVERVSGRRLVDASGSSTSRVALVVDIRRDAQAIHAVIRARGERSGERELSDVGETCAGLAEALALTLGLVVDDLEERAASEAETSAAPKAQAARRPPRPRTKARRKAPAPKPAAKLDPEPESAAAPERDAESGVSFALTAPDIEAGGGAAIRTLDTIAPFVHVDGEVWAGGVLSLGAGGFFVFPEAPAVGPGNVRVSLLAGSLRPCATVLGRRHDWRLAVCVQAMLGRMSGEGRQYDRRTSSASLTWSAFGVGVQGGGPLAGPLGWSARAVAFATGSDVRFTVDGIEDEYAAPRAGGLASAGLRWAFD